MRKLTYTLLLTTIICLTFSPLSEAGRKVKKTGDINGDEYVDSKYGFTIKMNDEWKVKVNKEGDPFRLVMTQKNFSVPPDYQDAPDYTRIPKIVMYVDTSSMDIGQFIDSLASETYDSEQKKEILKEFEIFFEPELIPQDKKRFSVGDAKAYSWVARAMYTKEVATSASSIGGKRVKGSYGGAVVGFKQDDLVVLFHVMSEYQYFNDIYNELMKFVNAVEWKGSKS